MAIDFTPQGIAEQRKVCEAATAGPWICDETGIEANLLPIAYANTRDGISWSPNDQRFIALSRTAYPAALTEIERLAAHNKQLQEAYQRTQDGSSTYTHTLNSDQQSIVDRLRYGREHGLPVTIQPDEAHMPMNAIEQNAALRAQVAILTRERDAEKRRADAGAIRTAVRPFEKGDKNTLTKYTQFCKRLAASHKPEMPSEDRMLLLLTDLCIDRLCVSMQGLTVERDAAAKDLKTALTEMWIDGRGDETNICWACANAKKRDLDAWPCSSCLDHEIAEFVHRGQCADNAPEGAESEGSK